jgi:hypothetical protein
VPTVIQWRRGTTAQTATFTGSLAEVTVDTDKDTLVVHDGATVGGYPLAKSSELQDAYNKANAAFDYANTASGGLSSLNVANAAFLKANSAYDSQNVTGTYANAAYAQANSAVNPATSGAIYANGAFAQANAAFTYANNANLTRFTGMLLIFGG